MNNLRSNNLSAKKSPYTIEEMKLAEQMRNEANARAAALNKSQTNSTSDFLQQAKIALSQSPDMLALKAFGAGDLDYVRKMRAAAQQIAELLSFAEYEMDRAATLEARKLAHANLLANMLQAQDIASNKIA